MPRIRDLGVVIGTLPTGPTNSLADVPGVGVGHATIVRDEPRPPAGRGVARTGVTVVCVAEDAYRRPVPAGGAILNGAGECTGFITAGEWGLLETPILLTSTMQLGRVYDAACQLMVEADPAVAEDVVIPVVAECDDSFLSAAGSMQLDRADVERAWRQAHDRARHGTPCEEGSVGSGTGMTALGFKGGIGNASRRTPAGHTVGVLVMANFGQRDRLTVDGVPVGRLLGPDPYQPKPEAGSCIAIVVTDAPVDSAGCARLARRVGLGLARTGSYAHHGSGEIFVAAATGLRAARGMAPSGTPIVGTGLNDLFAGVVDASEEAVLNAMACSETMTGRDSNTAEGLPPDAVRSLLARAYEARSPRA